MTNITWFPLRTKKVLQAGMKEKTQILKRRI